MDEAFGYIDVFIRGQRQHAAFYGKTQWSWSHLNWIKKNK